VIRSGIKINNMSLFLSIPIELKNLHLQVSYRLKVNFLSKKNINFGAINQLKYDEIGLDIC
jgi:hypothetical protein